MRVGYYGPEHVAALQLIRELQDDGFNLAAIKRLLSDRERTEERLERFRASLMTPADTEPPQTLTAFQLRDRLGLDGDEAGRLLGRAERLGVIVRLDDGRYEAPSPSLLALAEEVVASGISLAGALDVYELAQERVDPVAAAFIRRFVADVWREFEQAGMPIDRWPQVNDAIERLRRVARAAVAAAFVQRLDARIDDAFRPTGDRAEPRLTDG
jgi:DNA-binding transcriptional MerR regulator